MMQIMVSSDKKDSQETEPLKRPAYPYYPFKRCLEVAGIVNAAGGARGDVAKDVLAHELNVGLDSAVFSQLLGAAKAFGLIGGRGNYSLTDLAKQYFYPTDEQQRRLAQLQMLKGPTVFEKLIDRFDGSKLPSAEMLRNIIRRDFRVPDSWIDRTVSLFLGAIRDVGVLDANGFLRYGSAIHGTPANSDKGNIGPTAGAPSSSPTPSPSAPPTPPTVAPTESTEACIWMFRMGSAWVRVETSKDMSRGLWDKLQQYIQVLEPPVEKKEEK